MVGVQDLIAAEQDVMTMVGYIVWSFEDNCTSTIWDEFCQPLHKRKAALLNATNPHENDEEVCIDTNELLKRYYQKTVLQVAEFTETILYSTLFYKWAETQNGTASTAPSKWKESLPNDLRQATRSKANRILCSLTKITRLRLDALDHLYNALRRAEQLAYGYIQRKGDNILNPYISEEEQQATLDRLEEDAINYVNRQVLTQLKMHQQHANQELHNTMTDIINASLENADYCQRLHRWAERTVSLSNIAPRPISFCGEKSSETSVTETVEDGSCSNNADSEGDNWWKTSNQEGDGEALYELKNGTI